MAVKSVKQRHERRRSTFRDGKLVHTLVFMVTCDAIGDGPATAITASGVPGPGSYLVGVLPKAKLSGKDCDPVQGSGMHFDVVCEFTQVDDPEKPDNPLEAPPEFSWTYAETTEPYFIDETPDDVSTPDGKHGPRPVVNTAGDAFENFMDRESGVLTITMTRNEATYDPSVLDAYKDTVNKNAVTLDATTYAAGTLKLSPITATKQYATLHDETHDGTKIIYYKRVYVFKARHEGWRDHPLDIGFNELVPDPSDPNKPGKVLPIVDSAGLVIKKPWPLDGHGRKKPKATDKPEVLEFRPYKEMDWTPINLVAVPPPEGP